MSRPSFAAGYTINGIVDLGGGIWEITGDIVDYTPCGFGPLDAEVGNYVYFETDTGNIDQYVVTEIVSAAGATLVCKIKFNEPGTPDYNSPSSYTAAICKFPDEPPFSSGISDFLHNGIRNLNAKLLNNTYMDIISTGASGSQSVFNLTKTPTGIGQVSVFLNGVLQPAASFTIDAAAKTVTFTQNVPAGWAIAALYPVHPYDY